MRDGPGMVESLWRYSLAVVAVMVVCAVAGYLGVKQLPPRYQAQAKLILRDPGSPGIFGVSGSNQTIDLQTYLAKQSEIATSTMVLQRATKLLPSGQSPQDLRQALVVQPSKDLATITIQATAGAPDAAAAMANAVGDAYQQVTMERSQQQSKAAVDSIDRIRAQLQSELAAAEQAAGAAGGTSAAAAASPVQAALASQIAALRQREQDIAAQAAVYGSGVDLFERAEVPRSSSQLGPKLGALLGALLGLIVAWGGAWWAAGRNRRAETRDDPAPILGVPLLGEVPEFHAPSLDGTQVPSPGLLGPVVAEAYHVVVGSLEHVLAGVGGTSVVVTSAAPGDGKTLTALNLAIAAQQQNRRIVLVDADVRSRRLSELCGKRDGHGLTDLGEQPVDAKQLLHCLDLVDRGIVLSILPTGSKPEHPAGFFRTPAFRNALVSLEEQTDMVLIDTPAVLGVSDTIVIAGQADSVVLVVNRGVPLSHLRQVRERLAFISTPLVGYIFNRGSASVAPYARDYGPIRGSRLLRRPGARVRVPALLGGRRRRNSADDLEELWRSNGQ
jgi:Mrp family chromosome partitioning ATPase